MKKGKLIVVEGTDCSGKETQVKRAVARFKEMGLNIYNYSFPMYDTPTGRIVGGPYLGKSYICEGWFPEGATNVDALAVAVGTNHGQYKSKTDINFDLLKEIHETVDIPLVIHGGTGVKEEDIHKCTNYGVRKFNVGTELLVGWTKKAMEKFATTKENASLRNNIVPCNEVVYEIVKHKIGIFLNK